jgi:hypothetical protein
LEKQPVALIGSRSPPPAVNIFDPSFLPNVLYALILTCSFNQLLGSTHEEGAWEGAETAEGLVGMLLRFDCKAMLMREED